MLPQANKPLRREQPHDCVSPGLKGCKGAALENMSDNRQQRIVKLSSTMQRLARSKSANADLLVYSLNEVLDNAGPRQAEVLRRCALPRWFDAGVLAVLRENDEGNERLIELLSSYSFVRELDDGRLVYHRRVRAALLADWQRDRPAELTTLHERLADYFFRRTTPLGTPRPVLEAGSALSALPQSPRELWRREAIYHLLQYDQQRGIAELREEFEALERGHRQAEAERLLQAATEAGLDAQGQQWLRYLYACMHQGNLQLADAERELRHLLDEADLPQELTIRARRALGEVLAESGQWATATGFLRESLDFFDRTGDSKAAADTRLLLGEAYQGLGDTAGSWNTTESSSGHPLHRMARFWQWLLSLPFLLISLGLRKTPYALPIARYCARYQNWLLIRLYNTAYDYYRQACEGYVRLQDAEGRLRAEQRLADLLLLYGYTDEARNRLDQLLEWPEAQDPYRRARLQRSLAECHLQMGDVGTAQVLLDRSLYVFRELGDFRREAAVLALQGRAAAAAGNVDGALNSFRSSLDYFRTLNYTAAREKILHSLRLWQRRAGRDQALAQRIAALIDAEPEKRYVGRFLARYLPLLQISTLLALPLALLAMAMAVPTEVVAQVAGGPLSLQTFYDPGRALGVLVLLLPIYLASYAVLAIMVIFVLPLSRIEEEQPDIIVTNREQIACYDHSGKLRVALPWASIHEWLIVDRLIWGQALSLYSRTFLADFQGRELRIDAIISWYSELYRDLEQRFAAIGKPVVDLQGNAASDDTVIGSTPAGAERETVAVNRLFLGYDMVRSVAGATLFAGVLLLLLCIAASNGWLPLIAWFGVEAYTLISLLGFSGLLILVPVAYWLINRPLKLQRRLELNDRWPQIALIIGALPVVLYLLSGGQAISVPILNVSTFLWGAYAIAEGIAALRTNLRRFRLLLVSLIMLSAFAYSAPRTEQILHQTLAQYSSSGAVAARFDEDASATTPAPETSVLAEQGYVAAGQAQQAGASPFETSLLQGESAFAAREYQAAINAFSAAIANAPADSPQQALAYFNRAWAYAALGETAAFVDDRNSARDICTRHPRTEICRDILSTYPER